MSERPHSRSARDWLQIACWVIVASLAVAYMLSGWDPALYIGAAILFANAIARAWPAFREERRRPH